VHARERKHTKVGLSPSFRQAECLRARRRRGVNESPPASSSRRHTKDGLSKTTRKPALRRRRAARHLPCAPSAYSAPSAFGCVLYTDRTGPWVRPFASAWRRQMSVNGCSHSPPRGAHIHNDTPSASPPTMPRRRLRNRRRRDVSSQKHPLCPSVRGRVCCCVKAPPCPKMSALAPAHVVRDRPSVYARGVNKLPPASSSRRIYNATRRPRPHLPGEEYPPHQVGPGVQAARRRGPPDERRHRACPPPRCHEAQVRTHYKRGESARGVCARVRVCACLCHVCALARAVPVPLPVASVRILDFKGGLGFFQTDIKSIRGITRRKEPATKGQMGC
jgi:hypothetical protein